MDMSDALALQGVFIGVNEYGPGFTQLGFARRDAEVTRALFLDSYQTKSEPALLLDREATRSRIIDELVKLSQTAKNDDIAIIMFSGHGTPDGYLLPQDAMADQLPATALSTADFLNLVNRVDARVTLVILDCCFSGNAATKSGLSSGVRPTARDGAVTPQSVIRASENSTRAVLTACGPHQVAREFRSEGHGVLTYHLIKALLDESTIKRADGRISIYELYERLDQCVGDHYGRALSQNPSTAHAGNRVLLGPFRRGSRLAALPEFKRPAVVARPFRTLREHGIHPSMTGLWEKQLGGLNDSQIQVLNTTGLLRGKNVLVPAPTSSGKTLLGEIAALRRYPEARPAVFIVPTRALASDHAAAFAERYRPLGLRVVVSTGEIRDQTQALLSMKFDLAVCTYEKFLGLVNTEPGLLERIKVLVVDEIQHLAVPGRGPALELLLTAIALNRRQVSMPQVIGLSATLTHPALLADWLSADVADLTEARREPPLTEGIVFHTGRYRHIDADGEEATKALFEPIDPIDDDDEPFDRHVVHSLVKRLLADGDQIIVFAPHRHDARTLAAQLAAGLRLPRAHAAEAELPQGDDTLIRERLRECLKGGVAFHTADLDPAEKKVVETAFRRTGEVRVIVCTATLAQGVNLPAASVIIDGLHRGDGALPVEDYKNMVGRAGRTGGVGGRSFIVLADEDREQIVWHTHVTGRPDELESRLHDRPTDLRPAILAALSNAVRCYDRTGRSGIDAFLSVSFAAHQARSRSLLEDHTPAAEITATVAELRGAGFVRDESSRLELTPLGQIACRSGLGVDAVIAVARALLEIDPGALNAATLICLLHLAADKGSVYIPGTGDVRRTQDTVAAWMQEEQHVPQSVLSELRRDRKAYVPRLLAAQVCLRWMEGVSAMKIEKGVPGFLRNWRPVVPVSQIAKQAADRVETVLDIAREIRPVTEFGGLARTLPVRLEFGVPETQVDLARQVGAAIGRFGYRSLSLRGFLAPNDVINASDTQLLECLNHDHDLVRTVREGAKRAWAEAQGADEGPTY